MDTRFFLKYEFGTNLTNFDRNLKFLLRENSDEAQQRFSEGCHVFQSFTVQFLHIQSWRGGIVPEFVVSFPSSFIVSAISTTPNQFFRFWKSNDQTIKVFINSKVAFERIRASRYNFPRRITSNFHLLIHVYFRKLWIASIIYPVNVSITRIRWQ